MQEQSGSDCWESASKGTGTIEKICKALELMRRQYLKVPFIAFYRKDYVHPDLSINDLWRVYQYKGKWSRLQTEIKNRMLVLEMMLKFQSEKLTRNESLPVSVRVLQKEDLDRLSSAQSVEEVNEIYCHFVLYYGFEIPDMLEADRKKRREQRDVVHEIPDGLPEEESEMADVPIAQTDDSEDMDQVESDRITPPPQPYSTYFKVSTSLTKFSKAF